MISVDLQEVGALVRDVASSLGVSCELEFEHSTRAKTLFIRSGITGTADVSLTTVEPGTLFWELESGEQADWLIKDEKDRDALFEDLRLMLAATFAGAISARGVIEAEGRKFRLSGPPSPRTAVARLGRHFAPYPAVPEDDPGSG
ncbi:MAG: hypothetical protein U0Q07_06715 [Acidimicrobiales bacterium]